MDFNKNIADDVWFEIFLRLPLTPIFKFRSVSKVWFSILSCPNFINKWYELNCSSLPWAMIDFATDRSPDTNKLRRNFTIVYPDAHSQFINDHPDGFSFNFLMNPDFANRINDEKCKYLNLSTPSNGLILCLIESYTQLNLYVCNPLTQKYVLLPSPPKLNGVISLISNECFPLISTGYKVIVLPRLKAAAKEFRVEMFCSDLGEWNTYDVSCPVEVTCRSSLYDSYLTHNGVFYWFQKRINNILAFSVHGNTSHGACGIDCRSINLPDPDTTDVVYNTTNRCIGDSEGLICYASIAVKDSKRSLSVWVLEDDWYLLHRDNRFNDMLAQMGSRLIGGAATADLYSGIRVLGFNPFDKNVVILGYKVHIWAYNTKTRASEQLCHPSFLGRNLPSVSSMSASAFAFKPMPTILPPVSRRDTSVLDGSS